MIVKFLRNKKGGSSKSIDYLLNKERVKEGTARILSGDETQTRQIINAITKKQKVTFGVLSFEEKNIPAREKQELMQEFEKTFLAGLDQEQYNILWVEHTDKGRLELNCIIPKVELSTGRSLNPYFHGADFHLADLFQKKANLKYGYSDPKDPSKSQTLQGEYKKTGVMKDYQELDKLLHKMVSEDALNSRAEIVEFLEDNGVIVRKKKDGTIGKNISIKLDPKHKSKRLSGGIYDEQFKNTRSLEAIRRKEEAREREFTARDTRAELKAVTERLSKAIQKRSEFNQEVYSKPKQSVRVQAPELDSPHLVSSGNDINALSPQIQVPSSPEELDTRTHRRPNEDTVLHQEGQLDDNTRESISRRIKARETALREFSEHNQAHRERILEQVARDSERLYPQAQRVVSERAERRTAREYISEAIRGFTDKVLSFGERLRRGFQEDNGKSRDTLQCHKESIEAKRYQAPSFNYPSG